MKLPVFIAKRYLFGKRSVRFVNVITGISIGGITIGVAALLVVLSVFNGFSEVVTSLLVGFDPHIRIEKPGGITQDEYKTIKQRLASYPQITASSPFISGKAVVVNENNYIVSYVKGIDEQTIGDVSGLKKSIIMGSLSLNDSLNGEGIVLGLSLANNLQSVVNQQITVVSPSEMLKGVTSLSLTSTKRLNVSGFFTASNREYDGNYAFVSIETAQQLFQLGNSISGIELRLTDFNIANELQKNLSETLGSSYIISTWQDLHKDLYFVMKLERWSGYIILSLIIAIACFNLMGSLAMSILEKRRDIGVLQTLGMTPKEIIKIFVYEGLLVGVIGSVCGIILGLMVLYLQINYQIFPLDTSVYIIPALPVKIEFADFLSVIAASLGLSLISAYYPARKISHINPAESIRWE